MEIISKIVNLLNYASDWFDRYIISGLAALLRALGDLIIKLLEFFIEIVKWLMSYL
jgi:hypothetical protein